MSALLRIVCAFVLVIASNLPVASACDDHDEPGAQLSAFVPIAPAAVENNFDDNLGYHWKTHSSGPNVTLVDAKNAALRYRPNGDGGIPINLTADWTTLNPVPIFFNQAANPDPQSPVTVTHFWLNLKLTNKTAKDWQGFKISIVDDNELPYFDTVTQTNGTLRHPDRAHLHSDSFDYDQLTFKNVKGLYSVQRTTNPSAGTFVIDNRSIDLSSVADLASNTGLYGFEFSDGAIAKNAVWAPTKFVYNKERADQLDFNLGASVLDIHAKRYLENDQTRTAFVLVLQAVPLPEPGALGLLVCLLPMVACRPWRGR